MNQAVEEMSHYPEADYIIVNDDFDQALDELQHLVAAQRLRTQPRSRRCWSDLLTARADCCRKPMFLLYFRLSLRAAVAARRG